MLNTPLLKSAPKNLLKNPTSILLPSWNGPRVDCCVNTLCFLTCLFSIPISQHRRQRPLFRRQPLKKPAQRPSRLADKRRNNLHDKPAFLRQLPLGAVLSIGLKVAIPYGRWLPELNLSQPRFSNAWWQSMLQIPVPLSMAMQTC